MDFTLFEATPGMRIVFLPDSPHFTIVTVSQDMCRFLGRQKEDLVGLSVFEAFPANPGDTEFSGHKNLSASLDYVLEHKMPHRMEQQRYDVAVGPAGFKDIYWSNYSVPVLADTGEVQYIIHTAEDITFQVNAEEKEIKVKGIEKAYNLFMQTPAVIGVVSGKNHVLQLANAQALRLWGKGPEIVGRPILDSIPELEGQGVIELFDHVLQSGETYLGRAVPVFSMAGGKEERHFFDIVYQPYYEDGSDHPTGVFTISHDVTELVEARRKVEVSTQELELAVEVAGFGTFRIDLLADRCTSSEKVNEWFGFTRQGYSREEAFRPIHPEDRDRVEQHILGTLQIKGDNRHDVTYRVIHPESGAVHHLRSFGRTLFNEGGKPFLIIGIIQNVTPQILHQQQLEESEARLQQKVLERTAELELLNDELQRSNRYLEDFAYAASHDLKEPLRKIRTFADRLRHSMGSRMNETEVHLLHRIESSADRMQLLVDDLLEFSHLSNGIQEIVEVDLNVKVAKVLNDLDLPIEEKGAQIKVEPLPLIRGYRRQLEQLFHNLISNALKYSKAGVAPEIVIRSRTIKSGEVPVSQTPDASDKSYHLIEVADNGIGFEQQYAEQIFDMFRRLHGKAEYAGTGIGLAIAKKVVENHQGYIWAESELGKGATFKVLLPVSSNPAS